eukprot:CAMPEP_0194300152 /NCGR_PEP_ID=MMETSP0169-20130528/61104_1 /TAXON_ID=218684 /ORGANISM="Corethron pennatum, Strain L29A3" /LENGTH=167 /DNA_ID=CAMNT_0039050297 /DNA_START=42 /DNA_END=546 /DNA_ORIENTATION=+
MAKPPMAKRNERASSQADASTAAVVDRPGRSEDIPDGVWSAVLLEVDTVLDALQSRLSLDAAQLHKIVTCLPPVLSSRAAPAPKKASRKRKRSASLQETQPSGLKQISPLLVQSQINSANAGAEMLTRRIGPKRSPPSTSIAWAARLALSRVVTGAVGTHGTSTIVS